MRLHQKSVVLIAFLFLASLVISMPLQLVHAQTTTVSVSPQTSTVTVGQSITVNVQLQNVQNLYGVDVVVDYNSNVLQLVNQQPDLGDSNLHGGGILHGDPLTTDAGNIAAGEIYYNTSLSTSTEYHLFATSSAPSQSFSGSGIIVTLTFKVLAAGQSPLTLTSTLADMPAADQSSEPIVHNDVSGLVTTPGYSAPSPTSTASPTSTPEFPTVAVLVIIVALASVAIVVAVRRVTKSTAKKTA
jgi:hypothetical protein